MCVCVCVCVCVYVYISSLLLLSDTGRGPLQGVLICESPTGYTFIPWHRHQIEGTTGFQCLFQKTQANVR